MHDLKRQLSVANHDKQKASTESNQQLNQLRVQNGKLKKELSSFTLEFFEEIEDLKFNYSEAKKKLALYEVGESSNTMLKKTDFMLDGIF